MTQKERSDKWYAANREVAKARAAKRRKEQRVVVNAYNQAYQKAHPEIHAKWRKANPDKWKGYAAKWHKKNPGKKYQYALNYRCRRTKGGGGHTLAQWHTLLEVHSYRCFYHRHFYGCDLILTRATATRDHVIPLSNVPPGTNNIENIVPACHSCNSRKSNKKGPFYVNPS